MKPYKDLNNDSGISAYEYNDTSIFIQFKTGKIYEYQESKIGASHLNIMKHLADTGNGLNAYIMKNLVVKNGFRR
jgi:hypothetical protein